MLGMAVDTGKKLCVSMSKTFLRQPLSRLLSFPTVTWCIDFNFEARFSLGKREFPTRGSPWFSDSPQALCDSARTAL